MNGSFFLTIRGNLWYSHENVCKDGLLWPSGLAHQTHVLMFHSAESILLKLPDGCGHTCHFLLMFFATDGVHVQCCEQPTNGITYFRAVASLQSIPDDLLPYVPLFCNVITK